MSIRLSEILEHDAPHLGVTTRKTLTAFYDAIKAALRQGELTPEGGALPTTMNTLLALLPGEQPPLTRDREITDWSVENDHKYAAFLDRCARRWEHGRPGRLSHAPSQCPSTRP